MTTLETAIKWQDIAPVDAVNIKLPFTKPDGTVIEGPVADGYEDTPRCPWPWDPQQLVDAPLGQYHCPYCGSMVMAGMEHIDYEETECDGKKEQRQGPATS